MDLQIKTFPQLTAPELYQILHARSKVFVVEQTCPYLDVDFRDQKALHLYYQDQESQNSQISQNSQVGQIQAYLRLIPQDQPAGRVTVGRVLTVNRGTGLGKRLLQEAIQVASNHFHPKELHLHAQCYAIPFYEKVGFQVCSQEFLEDDIPHKEMVLAL